MSLNTFLLHILNIMLGIVLGGSWVAIYLSDNVEANQHLKTTVFQPEYNHRIDIVTARLICDTSKSELYFLWYDDTMFVPQ